MVVPELMMTMLPAPDRKPLMLNARLAEMPPPPPAAPWEMYDWPKTWILPVIGKVASSPPLSRPPFRIRPGLPPTPGKSRTAPDCLARSSEFVYIVREAPGKVWVPAVAGLRMRVLFRPLPITTPLKTVSYVFATTGATKAPLLVAIPSELVFQMAAVQLAPEAWILVVVRLAARAVPIRQNKA